MITWLVEDVLNTNETMVSFLAHHNSGMVPHPDIAVLGGKGEVRGHSWLDSGLKAAGMEVTPKFAA